MTTNWKALAEQAIAGGYHPKNHWELMLGRHLTQFFPELVKELGADLEAYLQVQTKAALDLQTTMIDQGTDPQAARELALERLLPRTPDEEESPQPWETEGAQEQEISTGGQP